MAKQSGWNSQMRAEFTEEGKRVERLVLAVLESGQGHIETLRLDELTEPGKHWNVHEYRLAMHLVANGEVRIPDSADEPS